MNSSNVISIGEARGSFIASVSYYRKPDGEIVAVLDDMPVPVIEQDETIAKRFVRLAELSMDGALSFMRQAVRFDEETREAEAEIASEKSHEQ